MPIHIGDQIGDYEITGNLGFGGMGQVYQVRHTISHRIEAMKVLAPGRPVTDEIAGRFLREIQLLASLQHPNITALHTAFRHDGELIMIMEFVEGLTLSEKLSATPIMMAKGLNYIQQTLAGLAYAHDHGIIHRDIKPSNIMIGRDDQVKLLDFGLAFPTLGSQFTRSGMILGSLPFMSPEQVLGKQLDARSDIYSVGVTLYQLLTGVLPFEGASEYEIASCHLRSEPVDPLAVNRNIPPRLSKIVLKALAKSPDDRFRTAKEFLEALGSFPSGETTTLAIATLPDPTHTRLDPKHPEGASASSPQEKQPIDASSLDSISRDLAFHVGPIAKVIVSRAAKRAATLDDLFALVASEISTEKKRQDFLATRTKYSATK
jgi:eukaryotic-like serine/threonine-protein kinase